MLKPDNESVMTSLAAPSATGSNGKAGGQASWNHMAYDLLAVEPPPLPLQG